VLTCAEDLSEEDMKRAIRKARVLYNRTGGGDLTTEPPPAESALSKYARDLTAAARAGELDPCVGRADELRRCCDILSRRTKNNPVLIGEPGVGKTAIVEGLAQRIVAGDVPDSLKARLTIPLPPLLPAAGAAAAAVPPPH